ncbi:hypothetical protein HDU97_007707 [Phlyctochytrium planicorne]|nr:hypothetical protein HDU97_007707 [Phlyctochytrium planicorne]
MEADRDSGLYGSAGNFNFVVPAGNTVSQCCEYLNTQTGSYLLCEVTPPEAVAHIYRLNVNQVDVRGPIPAAILELPRLRELDISTNDKLSGTLDILNKIKTLISLAAANLTSVTGAVPSLPLDYCDYSNTKVCTKNALTCTPAGFVSPPLCAGSEVSTTLSDPGATQSTINSPAPTDQPSTNSPSKSVENDSKPGVDRTLIIGIGSAVGLAVLVMIGCLLYRIPRMRKSSYGVVAKKGSRRDLNEEGATAGGVHSKAASANVISTGLASTATSTDAKRDVFVDFDETAGPPVVVVEDTDVTLVSSMLARSGAPPRTFSLSETRKARSEQEIKMDKEAIRPFVESNGGSEDFPVSLAHLKTSSDELVLRPGDTVFLSEVYRDGWAEGVSRRTGGPAVFPIACLGGGVPVVLAKRISGLMRSTPAPQPGTSEGIPGAVFSMANSSTSPTSTTAPQLPSTSALSTVLGSASATPPSPPVNSPAQSPGAAAPIIPAVANLKKVHAPSPLRSALTLDDIVESDEEEEEGDEARMSEERSPSPIEK